MRNDANDSEFSALMTEYGFAKLRNTQHGVVGLMMTLMYTVGIAVDIRETHYRYRYCFPTLLEASGALEDWATAGYVDEPKGYIVRKGEGGDKRPGAQGDSDAD